MSFSLQKIFHENLLFFFCTSIPDNPFFSDLEWIRRRFEVTKYLLENGANIDAKDIYGQTPMHLSSLFGD